MYVYVYVFSGTYPLYYFSIHFLNSNEARTFDFPYLINQSHGPLNTVHVLVLHGVCGRKEREVREGRNFKEGRSYTCVRVHTYVDSVFVVTHACTL